MSVRSAIDYSEFGPGGSQNLDQVLTVGNNAGGNDVNNVGDLTCQNLTATQVIQTNTINCVNVGATTMLASTLNLTTGLTVPAVVSNIIQVGNITVTDTVTAVDVDVSGTLTTGVFAPANIATGTAQIANLQIGGKQYPLTTSPAVPNIGSNAVYLTASGSKASGGVETIYTATLPAGIYIVKTEIDYSAAGGIDFGKVSIVYKGVLEGFVNVPTFPATGISQNCFPCIAFIQSDGSVNGLTVTINVQTVGGGNYVIANDSDIDILRIF